MVTVEIVGNIYTGSYDWVNATVGELPPDWGDLSGADCYVKMKDSKDGHTMVVDIYDNSLVAQAYAYDTTTMPVNSSYGTVEFWLQTNNNTKYTSINFRDDAASRVFAIQITGGNLVLYNGGNQVLEALANDTWVHVRVDFERTAGAYLGLAQNKCQVRTDDTNDFGPYNFENNTDVDAVSVVTGIAIFANYHTYLDGLGLFLEGVGVNDYAIGDNLTAPDTDITSSTIDCKITTELRKVPKATMRVNGQTFENDDLIRVTDNYTSFKNGRGHYKDSCDFRSETIGSVPAQTDGGTWTDSDGADCESTIIDKYNGHSMILQLRDEGAGAATMDLDITNTATGKVEFWMATTDPTYELTITLLDQQPAIHAGLQIDNENINYYHDGGWVDSGEDAEVGKWYRCVIHFCCALHKSIYSVYDSAGTEIFTVSNKDSPAPSSTVNDIKFTTQTTDAHYLCFIDAIGFDWDTTYTLGDNADLEVTLADQTIFEGQIIKQNKRTIQTLQLKSITAEMEQSIDDDTDLPAGYIPNMLSVLAGKMDHVTATEQSEIYRGTYNFMNEANGALPFGMTKVNTQDLKITADFLSHKKVLELEDDHAGENVGVYMYFEPQTNGTIEMWAASTDATQTASVIYLWGDNSWICKVGIVGDDIDAIGNITTEMLSPAVDNTWYRIRLDFECGDGGYVDAGGNTLAADTFSAYVYSDAGAELGNAEQQAFKNVSTYAEKNLTATATYAAQNTLYIDAIGFSWDYRYPEYHTYAVGDNKQILVDEHEASTIRAAVHTADVVINKSNKASKVYNDLSDEELSTWYILPSKEISMNLGDEDSGFDLASGDKVWAVKGIDNITRINKVVVKGGDDGVDWALGEADDLDAQATYGIKLIMVYAPEIKNDTDADNLAAEILVKYQNAPNKTSFFLHDTTYGMLQVGETITIPADTFYYSKSLTFIAEGEWIITKIVYEPDTGISQITVVDNLVFEPDEDDIKFIEDMVRQI